MLTASIRSNPLRQVLEPSVSEIGLDWDLAFTREPTKQGLAYWQSLCAGRAMPRRQELSPARMRPFLTHVNLVEIIRAAPGAPPDFVVTLQGQHARDVYGPIAHRKLSEVLPAHIVQRWRTVFGIVTGAARPVRFFSSFLSGGNACLRGEVLFAPLGDDAYGVEALFGILATWSDKR